MTHPTTAEDQARVDKFTRHRWITHSVTEVNSAGVHTETCVITEK